METTSSYKATQNSTGQLGFVKILFIQVLQWNSNCTQNTEKDEILPSFGTQELVSVKHTPAQGFDYRRRESDDFRKH